MFCENESFQQKEAKEVQVDWCRSFHSLEAMALKDLLSIENSPVCGTARGLEGEIWDLKKKLY